MTTTINKEDILHLLTGRTPLGINRLISHQMKEYNISLTKEQWSILAVLWEEDGCTQQKLADATYRDRPGVSRLLDNLQKEQFIERRPDADDRRINLIYLTEKGKMIQEPVLEALNNTVAAITQNISEEQIDNLRETLDQINENIRRIENK